jgi:hypothetical protein
MKPEYRGDDPVLSNSGGEVGQAVGDVRTGLANHSESLGHACGVEGQENDHCDNQEEQGSSAADAAQQSLSRAGQTTQLDRGGQSLELLLPIAKPSAEAEEVAENLVECGCILG